MAVEKKKKRLAIIATQMEHSKAASSSHPNQEAAASEQKRLKITRRESGHCASPSISVTRGAEFLSPVAFSNATAQVRGGVV